MWRILLRSFAKGFFHVPSLVKNLPFPLKEMNFDETFDVTVYDLSGKFEFMAPTLVACGPSVETLKIIITCGAYSGYYTPADTRALVGCLGAYSSLKTLSLQRSTNLIHSHSHSCTDIFVSLILS